MNYLAHAYLSCSNGGILVGNFIADSLTKKEEPNYTGDILKGIMLHREIDSFTDKHPMVREAVKILRPNHGKYAPVVTDLLWDHILIKYWSNYSGDDLAEFIANVYEIVLSHKTQLPHKLKPKIDRMVSDNFLNRYGSLAGVKQSLAYMDRRTKFPSNFVTAVDDYSTNELEFDRLFNAFFPDLIALVDAVCDC